MDGSIMRGLQALASDASAKVSLAKDEVQEALALIRYTPEDADEETVNDNINDALSKLDDVWWILSELEDR